MSGRGSCYNLQAAVTSSSSGHGGRGGGRGSGRGDDRGGHGAHHNKAKRGGGGRGTTARGRGGCARSLGLSKNCRANDDSRPISMHVGALTCLCPYAGGGRAGGSRGAGRGAGAGAKHGGGGRGGGGHAANNKKVKHGRGGGRGTSVEFARALPAKQKRCAARCTPVYVGALFDPPKSVRRWQQRLRREQRQQQRRKHQQWRRQPGRLSKHRLNSRPRS